MSRLLLLICLVGLTTMIFAKPAERSFLLNDYLGHAWTNELIHYSISCQPGECWPQGMRLLDGQRHPIPVQLSDITLHKDGSIATAAVWFITTLPANGTLTYTLQEGSKRGNAARYTTDLKLAKEKRAVVLSTSNIAVRVLNGTMQYPSPQPAAAVPAPLQGVRLRSGGWTGRGWLETAHRCIGYTATITDDGPVFKQAVIRYTFATPPGWARAQAPFYTMSVRVAAGQEIAYITEEYNLGDPTVYQEPKFASEKQEMLWDWWSWRPHQAPDNCCFSLYGAFTPTRARTIEHNVTTPDKGKSMNTYGENDYPLQFTQDRLEFTLNPWTRFEPDQSMIYTAYRAEDPKSDILAIMPCMASHWRNPDMLPHEPNLIKQHTDTNDLRVYTSAKPDLYFRAPLSLGRREWALAVLRNPGVVTEATDYTVDAGLLRKYGAFPLDKVKDWVLDWPATNDYPHLYVKAGDLAAKQERLKLMPASPEALSKAYTDLQKEMDDAISGALSWPCGGERTGINAFPSQMRDDADRADVLLASTALTAEQRKALRARVAFLCYLMWDGEYFPPRKAGFGWGSANMPVSVGSGRAVMSAMLSDHPMAKQWIGDSVKYFNYVMQMYYGEDGSSYSCPHYMAAEGLPLLNVIKALGATGLIANMKETFPNFHKYARFVIDMLPPKDIRFGQRILPTEGDTYWEGSPLAAPLAGVFRESDPQLACELLWAAQVSGMPAEHASAYAPNLTPLAARLGSVMYPGYGAFLRSGAGSEQESYLQVRFGNFTIDHAHNDAGSLHWYARGVPLAMDFASMYTPRTSSPWWHSTLSYNHQEHTDPAPCPGRGQPGCFYTGKSWYEHKVEPNTALAPIPDTTASNITEVNGQVVAFASQPGADYLCGAADRHWFEKLPYYYRKDGDPDPWSAFTEFEKVALTHPFRWTRQYAFVKDDAPDGPNYLLIADDLAGNSELEPAFNFWCLATNVVQNNRQLYFAGQFGIDLDMFVLEPAGGRIQLGEWGHHQAFLIGGAGLDENQKLARVFGKPDGGGFRVLLYPREANDPMPRVDLLAKGKLVKVTLPDQTHWILLNKDPVTVSDGNVTLSGTAAVVKQWQDGRTRLILLAPGKIDCAGKTLESAQPASVDK